MRTLPTGTVDPNFGRRVGNRRQCDSLQNTCLYGSRMPIEVRYTEVVFSRSGWLMAVFFQAEDGIRDSSVTGVQTCALPICPRESLWPGAQTITAALSGDSLGQDQTGPIQFAPGHIASAAEARGRWLGNVSDYPGGIWAWLSLRMRVLHGDGIFWRLHPLSYQ